ncbi:MAG: hypothetical protein K6347_03095 [Campylobacterales bacterium]
MIDFAKLKEMAKGIKVLYVEDHDEVREVVTRTLSHLFDELYTAKNGA